MEVKIPFLRTGFNYDRDAASDESGIECLDPTLAQQQFRDEADINTIVRRFNLSGELPQGVSVPQYGDFTEVSDYHSALNLVIAADDAFMALPAYIRSRFENDAGKFVDFVSDEKNLDEARALGLVPGLKKQNLDPNPQDLGQKASGSAPAPVDKP